MPEAKPSLSTTSGSSRLARGDVATAETLLMDAQKKSPAYYEKASRNLDQARAMTGGAVTPR